MWFRLLSYLKFLTSAGNKHNVHSPFIFKFYTEALLKKPAPSILKKMIDIRQVLLANKSYIDVQDFGKGSLVFRENRRQVSKIARVAGLNLWKAKKLAKVISHYKPKTILELGTSVGLGTSCMRISNKASHIFTVEGCKNTAAVAQSLFNDQQLHNIELIVGKFDDVLPALASKVSFDLIYIDGNHDGEATLKYFEICLSALHQSSIIIFDDIYWSKDMNAAWEILKQHPKVTSSIDIYYWGILFLNTDLSRQHFKLKC